MAHFLMHRARRNLHSTIGVEDRPPLIDSIASCMRLTEACLVGSAIDTEVGLSLIDWERGVRR